MMSTLPTAQIVYVLNCQKQQNHQWMNVKLHNGLVTTIVMMETTMLNVDLMEVIAAKKIHHSDGTTIVLIVSVWTSQRQLKPQMDLIVRFHIILVTTFVMMKTTMLNVDLMVETVA